MRRWDVTTIVLLVAGFFLVAATGCTQPAPSTETPECFPMAMPTGEAFYPVEFQTAFPPQVTIGQAVHIQFTGGIMLIPSGVNCGGEVTVMPPNRATAQASARPIQVLVGDTIVFSQSCAYDCAITFVIPPDIAPGAYQWQLEIPWTTLEYPLQVLPPVTESSDGR